MFDLKSRRRLPFALVALALCAGGAHATTYFVDDDAQPGGDGLSWQTAFHDLQDALAVAVSGDVVRVAQGVYTPDSGTGDRSRSFVPASGVTMFGGHAGIGATNPDARDHNAFVTVLTGDLLGDDGPNFTNRGDNACNVFFIDSKAGIVIEGFTITGGEAHIDFRKHGGGIYSAFSGFTLRDCTIVDNRSERNGGGVALMNSFAGDILIERCRIVGNRGGLPGGGVAIYITSPLFVNCLIAGNAATSGGGVYNNGTPTFVNCSIVSNAATTQVGGGFHANDRVITARNTVLWNNTGLGSVEQKQVWLNVGTVDLASCSIQGLNAYAGNNNVALDPTFANLAGADGVVGTADDDPTLADHSPLIDMGDSSFLPAGVSSDFGGGPRLVGKAVDIGADEVGCPGDITGDGIVNFSDLNAVLNAFGQTGAGQPADVNSDGVVNFSDLNTVLNAFGLGC